MPIDATIPLKAIPFELPNPIEQQTKQQNLLVSQAQLKKHEYELQKLKSDEDKLNQFYAFAQAKSGFGTAEEIEDAMLRSGVPNIQATALQLKTSRLQLAAEKNRISDIMGGGTPTSTATPTGAPAAGGLPALPTASTAPTTKFPTGMSLQDYTAGLATPSPYYQGANQLAANVTPTTTAAPVANAPVANALAPAPAAAPVVNALAAPVAGAPDISELRRRRDLLLQEGSPRALKLVESIDKDIALLSKEPVYHNVPGVGLVDPRTGKVIVESKDKTELQRNYTAAVNQGFKGSIFDYERAIKMAGRPPAALPTPSAPVEVRDPNTGKSIFVSREEAIKGRMTPSKAIEGVAPKDIQKREAVYPQATSAIKGFEAKSQSFIKDLETLRDHPGLSSITGIVAGRLPALTPDGRAAQALYDKIVAKGGFQALQELREMSKTGGALGSVSNQENKQLIASFAAIDQRQDAPNVKDAIDQAISDIQGATTRSREAYDMTYEYKDKNTPTTSGFRYLGKESK